MKVKTLLDKKIVIAAFMAHHANCYDDQINWEERRDELQEIRNDIVGEWLEVNTWIIKIDELEDHAKVWRGDLIRVGNLLMPSIERLKGWRDYAKVVAI